MKVVEAPVVVRITPEAEKHIQTLDKNFQQKLFRRLRHIKFFESILTPGGKIGEIVLREDTTGEFVLTLRILLSPPASETLFELDLFQIPTKNYRDYKSRDTVLFFTRYY